MHRRAREYSDIFVKYAVDSGKLTQDDANLLLDFMKERGEKENSATRYTNFYDLVVFRQYIGEFRHTTGHDLCEGISKFKNSGREVATLSRYLTILRRFYLWLADNGYSPIEKNILDHKLKVLNQDSKKAARPGILTIEDLAALHRACKNSRDRALIALLFDTGIKTKDACRIRWDQCRFDEKGLVLLAGVYTKCAHDIRCSMAGPYVADWKKEYPGNPAGENPLFVTKSGAPLTHQATFRLLGKIVKNSGIKKSVHVHLIQPKYGEKIKTEDNRNPVRRTIWRIEQ